MITSESRTASINAIRERLEIIQEYLESILLSEEIYASESGGFFHTEKEKAAYEHLILAANHIGEIDDAYEKMI